MYPECDIHSQCVFSHWKQSGIDKYNLAFSVKSCNIQNVVTEVWSSQDQPIPFTIMDATGIVRAHTSKESGT